MNDHPTATYITIVTIICRAVLTARQIVHRLFRRKRMSHYMCGWNTIIERTPTLFRQLYGTSSIMEFCQVYFVIRRHSLSSQILVMFKTRTSICCQCCSPCGSKNNQGFISATTFQSAAIPFCLQNVSLDESGNS